MPKNDFERLFPAQSAPRVIQAEPMELKSFKPPFDWAGWLAFALALGLTSWMVKENVLDQIATDDQEQSQPFEAEKVAKDSLVVFVLELKEKSIDQDLVLREAKKLVDEKKIPGFRSLDEELPEAEPFRSFAASKKVSLPAAFVVLDGKISRVAKFPKNREELERLLK